MKCISCEIRMHGLKKKETYILTLEQEDRWQGTYYWTIALLCFPSKAKYKLDLTASVAHRTLFVREWAFGRVILAS